MELYFVPKQAYQNALNATKADAVNAKDFEIAVLLEWIKLFEIDLNDDMVIFNVVDYYIRIDYEVYDDYIYITQIDCTDESINHFNIRENFQENNSIHIN